MRVKYFSTIRNYVLSVSSQRKKTIYHKNTNSRNIIGRNLSMVIPLLANQDLTSMVLGLVFQQSYRWEDSTGEFVFPAQGSSYTEFFLAICFVVTFNLFRTVVGTSKFIGEGGWRGEYLFNIVDYCFL